LARKSARGFAVHGPSLTEAKAAQFIHHNINVPSLEELFDDLFTPFADLQLDSFGTSRTTSHVASHTASCNLWYNVWCRISSSSHIQNKEEAWVTEGQQA